MTLGFELPGVLKVETSRKLARQTGTSICTPSSGFVEGEANCEAQQVYLTEMVSESRRQVREEKSGFSMARRHQVHHLTAHSTIQTKDTDQSCSSLTTHRSTLQTNVQKLLSFGTRHLIMSPIGLKIHIQEEGQVAQDSGTTNDR